MYSKTSYGFCVSVFPEYIGEQSSPAEDVFVWSYQIVIENHTNYATQLIRRYWKVIDKTGMVQEIEGDGVVGKQPTLHSEEAFTYSSWVTLPTESGIMVGAYQMHNLDKDKIFEIAIPAFSLDTPESLQLPN